MKTFYKYALYFMVLMMGIAIGSTCCPKPDPPEFPEDPVFPDDTLSFVPAPPETILITVNERNLLNYAKSVTNDPTLLSCVQMLATSGFISWFTWDEPDSCDGLLYEGGLYIDHYRIQFEADVPTNMATLFLQNGTNQRLRVYAVLSNGEIGCAPQDTSFSMWSEYF